MKNVNNALRRLFSGILIASLLFALLCAAGCAKTSDESSRKGLSSGAISLQDKTSVSPDPSSDLEATQTTVSEPNLSTGEESIEDPVWIPTRTGRKYHKKPTCSGMENPEKVSKETARQRGFTPCQNCY
ncbi:MAG: hypothetical protein J6M34_02660 [Clostridia bacterium]|nr:hypothetical protein [Clostridia bacterium]